MSQIIRVYAVSTVLGIMCAAAPSVALAQGYVPGQGLQLPPAEAFDPGIVAPAGATYPSTSDRDMFAPPPGPSTPLAAPPSAPPMQRNDLRGLGNPFEVTPGRPVNRPVQPPAIDPPADPAVPETVVDLQINGIRQVTRDELKRYIKTTVGRPFDQKTIEEDVRRLNSTGLFVQIRPSSKRTPKGRVVIFDLLERRIMYYVYFTGNEQIKRGRLAQEAGIEPGDPFVSYAIDEAVRKMTEFYRENGFSNAHISVLEGREPSDRGVIFLINEGVRRKVRWIEFVGNKIAMDERLKTQIQTSEPLGTFLHRGLIPDPTKQFGGDLNFEKLDMDVKALEDYYRSLGYFRCRVSRRITPYHDLWDFRRDESNDAFKTLEWVKVSFIIDEGPRYKIRDIRIEGNQQFATDELREELELDVNDYYNQAALGMDRGKIVEKYGNVGYIFADIKASPRLSEEPGWLTLVFQIDEGERAKAGKINVDIGGEVTHTKITTVLNRMSIYPGSVINIAELRASERRLRACGLFETNPQMGNPPKIAFSKPKSLVDTENDRSLAERTPDGFRGQSPDGYGGGDCVVDLTIQGTFRSEPNETPAEPRSNTRSVPAPSIPFGRPAPPRSNATPQYNASPRPTFDDRRMVVRGQNYTVPSLGRSYPRAAPAAPYGNNTAPPASNGLDWGQPPTNGPGVQNYTTNAPPAGGGVDTFPSTLNENFSSPTRLSPGRSAWDGLPSLTAPPASPVDPSPVYGQPMTPSFTPNGGGYSGPTTLIPGDSAAADPSLFLGRSPGDDPLLSVPLFPSVTEARTGELVFSVGVNSDAGLMGNILLSERNFNLFRPPASLSWYDLRKAFRGGGQSFRLEASPGTEVSRYSISFMDPYIFDTNYQFAVRAYYYSRYYFEWDEQRLGGTISVGREFPEIDKDLAAAFVVKAEQVDVFDPVNPTPKDLTDALGKSTLVSLRLQGSLDKRDSRFLPTEGYYISGGAEYVMGDFNYARGDIEAARYFTITRRADYSGAHVLGLRASMAVSGGDTPIYAHYFGGGTGSFRGFEYREASPRDHGTVIGGEFQFLSTAEYMFPLTQTDQLRGIVFCDAGTVEPTITNWDNDFRVAPGFGLRIAVPFMGEAPIALDFAFPVSLESGDQVQNFSFYIGYFSR